MGLVIKKRKVQHFHGSLNRSTSKCVVLIIIESLFIWARGAIACNLLRARFILRGLKSVCYGDITRCLHQSNKESKNYKIRQFRFSPWVQSKIFQNYGSYSPIIERNCESSLFVQAWFAVPGTGASLKGDGPARQSALYRKSFLFNLTLFFRIALFWVLETFFRLQKR